MGSVESRPAHLNTVYVKFFADMGNSRKVVQRLRTQDHDAAHLRDEGLRRLRDGEMFEKAAGENRIVLTFDLDLGEIVASSQGTRCPASGVAVDGDRRAGRRREVLVVCQQWSVEIARSGRDPGVSRFKPPTDPGGVVHDLGPA